MSHYHPAKLNPDVKKNVCQQDQNIASEGNFESKLTQVAFDFLIVLYVAMSTYCLARI